MSRLLLILESLESIINFLSLDPMRWPVPGRGEKPWKNRILNSSRRKKIRESEFKINPLAVSRTRWANEAAAAPKARARGA
jgi:hypothetical protein